MKVYESPDFGVEHKEDDSPLTRADKEAHLIIAKGLEAMQLPYPLLSEEGAHEEYETRKSWDTFWCVDPLDGTKEFIKRNGEFTVNIALIHQNYPILGVIYVPVFDTLYFADKNGAFKKEGANASQLLKVANQKTGDLVAFGSRSHSAEEEERVLKLFGVKELIGKGSSLKFCEVAEGNANVYFRLKPTMEWDTAAGQAIVEQAGGLVLNLDQKRFSYNKESLRNSSFLCLGMKDTDVNWTSVL